MKSFSLLTDACRTVHAFEPQSVNEKDVLEALDISLRAPNHRFTFPWRYIWPGKKQKQALADLAARIKFPGGPSDPQAIKAAKNKFLNPEIIVFCQKVSTDSFQSKEDYATLSCSVQLFALSLAEKGIGYKWSTGKVTRDPRAYEILDIDEKALEIIGFIFVGKASSPPKKRLRPQLSEVLTRLD